MVRILKFTAGAALAALIMAGCGGGGSSSSGGGSTQGTGHDGGQGGVNIPSGNTFFMTESASGSVNTLTQGERYRMVRDFDWFGYFEVADSAGKTCKLNLLDYDLVDSGLQYEDHLFSWSGNMGPGNSRFVDISSGLHAIDSYYSNVGFTFIIKEGERWLTFKQRTYGRNEDLIFELSLPAGSLSGSYVDFSVVCGDDTNASAL